MPFNPTDKYTIATIVENNGGKPYRLMKGAPQVAIRVIHVLACPCMVGVCEVRQSRRLSKCPAMLFYTCCCWHVQVVLKNCYNVNEIKGHIEEKITEFAGRGYRALGLAMSDGDDKSEGEWLRPLAPLRYL